jgi:alpha-glucoside transport system ATP-binding protein
MATLTITDLRKSYGAIDILHGINLDIRSGEFIVFVGPSGCGKSTLLRTIAGLEEITSGTIAIDGEVVNDLTPAEREIAMVFQSYALYPHMTVYDNMAFGLKMARETKAEIDRKVRHAADMLQLTPLLDRLPKQLSGGQRQRAAIGRAITRDPKLFLFDEPLSNLDAALRVATRIEIAGLKARMPDATMIYVTHDQVEAMTLATLSHPRQPLCRGLHRQPGDELRAAFGGQDGQWRYDRHRQPGGRDAGRAARGHGAGRRPGPFARDRVNHRKPGRVGDGLCRYR